MTSRLLSDESCSEEYWDPANHRPTITRDPLDDETVYLTEAYKEWQRHYLKRLAMKIHRLVSLELERAEEVLFMLFVKHDSNLDGDIGGEEAINLREDIEDVAPGSTQRGWPGSKGDGSISFVSLLQWYTDSRGRGNQGNNIGFNLTSMIIGMIGSGVVFGDGRLEALSYSSLRQNVVGYRKLLRQVREFQEERLLEKARQVERSNGLAEAMPEYYKVLAKEFESDGEHLFELFSEVDESNNLLLDDEEVRNLFQLLDSNASEADLRRYIAEINLNDGPLTFASFIDWWDQARSVENSLVAEKGAGLLASFKAQAARSMLGGFFSETAVQARWREAAEAGRLQALRQAYCRTLREVRDYKCERDLRKAEFECAAL